MHNSKSLIAVSALSLLLAAVGCKKKEESEPGKAAPASATKPATKDPKAEPAAEPVKAAVPALVEVDLSAWGPQWQGYVAMAPAGAKVAFDDPSRQLTISDVDFLSMGEAPYWEDGIKSSASSTENQNFKQVSATEARWERNPPLGKSVAFDLLITTGDAKWSCNGESFTSAEVADQLVAICKSVKKK